MNKILLLVLSLFIIANAAPGDTVSGNFIGANESPLSNGGNWFTPQDAGQIKRVNNAVTFALANDGIAYTLYKTRFDTGQFMGVVIKTAKEGRHFGPAIGMDTTGIDSCFTLALFTALGFVRIYFDVPSLSQHDNLVQFTCTYSNLDTFKLARGNGLSRDTLVAIKNSTILGKYYDSRCKKGGYAGLYMDASAGYNDTIYAYQGGKYGTIVVVTHATVSYTPALRIDTVGKATIGFSATLGNTPDSIGFKRALPTGYSLNHTTGNITASGTPTTVQTTTLDTIYAWKGGIKNDSTTVSIQIVPQPCIVMCKTGVHGTITRKTISSSGASLLGGMTPSSYALPSGWSLLDANGYESGSLTSIEHYYGGLNTETINTSIAHSGTHSMDTYVTHAYQGIGMQIRGTDINSRDVYVSWWQYTTLSNPGYGNLYTDDYFIGRFLAGVTNARAGFEERWPADTLAQPVMYAEGTGTLANPNVGVYAGTPTTTCHNPLGQWVQYEAHIKCNDPGINNGQFLLYQNGTLIERVDSTYIYPTRCPTYPGSGQPDCGYFNGTVDMAQSDLWIGGDWGAIWIDSTGTPRNQNMSACSGDQANQYGGATTPMHNCPPSGTIPYFHVYIDDVIVLKK